MSFPWLQSRILPRILCGIAIAFDSARAGHSDAAPPLEAARNRPMLERSGVPPFFLAALVDDARWVDQSAAAGFHPDTPTPGGDTALCAALRLGHWDAALALLRAGASANRAGADGVPPLAWAVVRRSGDVLPALLEAGADPNIRLPHPAPAALLERVQIRDLKYALTSDRGVTPLMCCAARGDVEGAVALMRAGARTNLYTARHKRYPINFAATQGYLFLMRVLLGRDPDAEPDLTIKISLSQQRAWVEKDGEVVNSTSISTGRKGYETPTGRFVITDKHARWTSTIYRVAMPHFQRLNCGAIGLHAGYVTGRPASHGCIRLPPAKAKEFFDLTKVGDEVVIEP